MRVCVCLGLSFLLAPSFVAYAQQRMPNRVMVRLTISDSNGKPYVGEVILQAENVKDAQIIATNRYGLAFPQLHPGEKYILSVSGFRNLLSFRAPPLKKSEQTIEVKLPSDRLKGKTASAGKGLIVFTYKDATEHPIAQAQLFAVDENGYRYEGRTNRNGIAKLELPVGHRYSFSTEKYKDFEYHSFHTESLSKQIAEITLQDTGKQIAEKGKSLSTPLPKESSKPPSHLHQSPINTSTTFYGVKKLDLRTAADSLEAARIKMRVGRTQTTWKTLTVPSRPAAQVPRTSKRIVEGVYMLAQAYREQAAKSDDFPKTSRFELLNPLLRNSYNNIACVVDVTCSMDPYIEEYLMWLVLASNTTRLRGTLFFNDGDGKVDAHKRIGETGGIHACAKSIKQIADTLVASLAYGCSGDAAENDLEALLYAQSYYPELSGILLVADNRSPVRDLELLDQLHIPVHIYLCDIASQNGRVEPHPDYVTIAAKTQGSIHTLQEDLDLRKAQLDNQTLRLGNREYRLLKGRFTRQ